MANTKSSKKDMRRSARKRAINTSVKSALKTHIKKVKVAAKAGEPTEQVLGSAVSAIDKAVQRGIIHKNQAARRKSRIMKAAHVAKTAPAPVAVEVVKKAPKATNAKTAKKAVAKK
jgi:small subunit ribosomal protein S20